MKIIVNEIVKKYDVVVNQTTKQVNVNIVSQQKQFSVIISPLGKRGFVGLTNYEIAVKNGYLGTEAEWLESQKNIDGGLIF